MQTSCLSILVDAVSFPGIGMASLYHADTSLCSSLHSLASIHYSLLSFSLAPSVSSCAPLALQASPEPALNRVRVQTWWYDWLTPFLRRPSAFSLRPVAYPLRFVNIFTPKLLSFNPSPDFIHYLHSYKLSTLQRPMLFSFPSRPTVLLTPKLNAVLLTPNAAAFLTSPTLPAHPSTPNAVHSASMPTLPAHPPTLPYFPCRLSLPPSPVVVPAFPNVPARGVPLSSSPWFSVLLDLFAPTANRPTRRPAHRFPLPACRPYPRTLASPFASLGIPLRPGVPGGVRWWGSPCCCLLDPTRSRRRHASQLECSTARKGREKKTTRWSPQAECLDRSCRLGMPSVRPMSYCITTESALRSWKEYTNESRMVFLALFDAQPSRLCVLPTLFSVLPARRCQRITKPVTRDALFTNSFLLAIFHFVLLGGKTVLNQPLKGVQSYDDLSLCTPIQLENITVSLIESGQTKEECPDLDLLLDLLSPPWRALLLQGLELNARERALEEECAVCLQQVLMIYTLQSLADHTSYLPLPALLAAIEQEPFYILALPQGRLWYRYEQYTLDEEALEVVRCPVRYTRQQIAERIKGYIRIADDVLAVAIPLTFRVGMAVGWLSGLSVSQKEDAQAGLVLLTAYVSPLLVPQQAGPGAPRKTALNLAAKPSATTKPVLGTSPAGSLPAPRLSSRKQSKKR